MEIFVYDRYACDHSAFTRAHFRCLKKQLFKLQEENTRLKRENTELIQLSRGLEPTKQCCLRDCLDTSRAMEEHFLRDPKQGKEALGFFREAYFSIFHSKIQAPLI